jgi:type II secretory pathway component PulK
MWSSNRSSRRAPDDEQGGYALLSALVLAVLFFGLITLVLWESTLRYRAAQGFRARIEAQTLATNAAELAAKGLADGSSLSASVETEQGTMAAKGHASQDIDGSVRFEIEAEGVTRGPRPAAASVKVKGVVEEGRVRITSSKHSQ